jgi:hypothetical protein
MTKERRPEQIAVHPVTGQIYVVLENNGTFGGDGASSNETSFVTGMKIYHVDVYSADGASRRERTFELDEHASLASVTDCALERVGNSTDRILIVDAAHASVGAVWAFNGNGHRVYAWRIHSPQCVCVLPGNLFAVCAYDSERGSNALYLFQLDTLSAMPLAVYACNAGLNIWGMAYHRGTGELLLTQGEAKGHHRVAVVTLVRSKPDTIGESPLPHAAVESDEGDEGLVHVASNVPHDRLSTSVPRSSAAATLDELAVNIQHAISGMTQSVSQLFDRRS